MQKKVLLDVDGILTDFHSAVARIATDAGFPMSADRMAAWDIGKALEMAGAPADIVSECLSAIASAGFNTKLIPHPAAVKWLPALQEIASVTFVTTPNIGCSSWVLERTRWMKKHFGVPAGKIVFSFEKHSVSGDIFVDDNPDNVASWAAGHPGKTALLWDAPYNVNSSLRRIKLWEGLVSLCRDSV